MKGISVFFMMLLLFLASSVSNAINKCVDATGKVSYQDKACPEASSTTVIKEKKAVKKAELPNQDPEKFFSKYVELSNAFDVSVANLYADDARVHSYRVSPHGLERVAELTGNQYAGVLRQMMPVAKQKNDKSDYKNITVTRKNGKYKIKADRYSQLKCYLDTGYYMFIEPVGGTFVIVEEYFETQPDSQCEEKPEQYSETQQENSNSLADDQKSSSDNMTSFLIALLGALVVFIGFFFAGKSDSALKSNSIKVFVAISGFAVIPVLNSLLGLPVESAAKSGEYWFYLMLAGVVFMVLLRSKK